MLLNLNFYAASETILRDILCDQERRLFSDCYLHLGDKNLFKKCSELHDKYLQYSFSLSKAFMEGRLFHKFHYPRRAFPYNPLS